MFPSIEERQRRPLPQVLKDEGKQTKMSQKREKKEDV